MDAHLEGRGPARERRQRSHEVVIERRLIEGGERRHRVRGRDGVGGVRLDQQHRALAAHQLAREILGDGDHELHVAAGGITVLVSTHYMDEAERCHQIGYIAQGRLLVHGSVQEVVRSAGISAWRITGPRIGAELPRIKGLPGVEMAALFGAELHVSGEDPALIEKSLGSLKSEDGLRVERVEPTLEDVFIHTMTVAVPEHEKSA